MVYLKFLANNQSNHLHPGNYSLNWQNSPLKQAGGDMFHLTNLWKYSRNFVTTSKFTITQILAKTCRETLSLYCQQDWIIQSYPRNQNIFQISLFLELLEKKTYCCTQDINWDSYSWKNCAMIIHNLLINQIINFVLKCQSAI